MHYKTDRDKETVTIKLLKFNRIIRLNYTQFITKMTH
jgi:hypothetical protein